MKTAAWVLSSPWFYIFFLFGDQSKTHGCSWQVLNKIKDLKQHSLRKNWRAHLKAHVQWRPDFILIVCGFLSVPPPKNKQKNPYCSTIHDTYPPTSTDMLLSVQSRGTCCPRGLVVFLKSFGPSLHNVIRPFSPCTKYNFSSLVMNRRETHS